jgi:hypothetical protein
MTWRKPPKRKEAANRGGLLLETFPCRKRRKPLSVMLFLVAGGRFLMGGSRRGVLGRRRMGRGRWPESGCLRDSMGRCRGVIDRGGLGLPGGRSVLGRRGRVGARCGIRPRRDRVGIGALVRAPGLHDAGTGQLAGPAGRGDRRRSVVSRG